MVRGPVKGLSVGVRTVTPNWLSLRPMVMAVPLPQGPLVEVVVTGPTKGMKGVSWVLCWVTWVCGWGGAGRHGVSGGGGVPGPLKKGSRALCDTGRARSSGSGIHKRTWGPPGVKGVGRMVVVVGPWKGWKGVGVVILICFS